MNLFVAGFIGSPKMNFIAGELLSATPTEATVRLHDGTPRAVSVDATGVATGTPVTLGIRPEHVIASPNPSLNAVKCQVQLAEHLGDTTYLHILLTGGTDTLTVRTEPENPLDTGDMAYLTLPPKRCFLFDDKGKTLSRVA